MLMAASLWLRIEVQLREAPEVHCVSHACCWNSAYFWHMRKCWFLAYQEVLNSGTLRKSLALLVSSAYSVTSRELTVGSLPAADGSRESQAAGAHVGRPEGHRAPVWGI